MTAMIKYLDLKAINRRYVHAADEVLASGWYLRGEATRRFEQHYAEYIGTRHCIGVANGLDALTLIIRAYKEMGAIHDGDEVIVPANTYIASILAITENNLTPVLVEPDINTLQIDDTLIEQAITVHTRALMLVHLYGRCAYTERIGNICRRHRLLLIEDNAQAHGTLCEVAPPPSSSASPIGVSCEAVSPLRCSDSPSGVSCEAVSPPRHTGALGHAAGHSFYPGKNLGAMGDAGAVTTDDDELAAIVRSLGNYGSTQKYVFDHVGRNSRIDELQAAILDAKLQHLDEANHRRKAIAAIYINKVENPLIRIPQSERDSVFHIFPVFCDRRDALQQYLLAHGVETQIHYPIPPHRQRCYSHWSRLDLPVTERIHSEELSLPCNEAMTDDQALYITDLLNHFR